MKCWHCGTELIWGGDFTFEDYGLDEDRDWETPIATPTSLSV